MDLYCGAVGVILYNVVFAIAEVAEKEGVRAVVLYRSIMTFTGVSSALLGSLGFFVAAQLLQLALDARRDLAKLVANRQQQ